MVSAEERQHQHPAGQDQRASDGQLALDLGRGLEDIELAKSVAAEIGYPVLIKAAGGGGGRGMRVARDHAMLAEFVPMAQAEAQAFFGNPSVFLERYFDRPRHIEMQILADGQGNVIHLG